MHDSISTALLDFSVFSIMQGFITDIIHQIRNIYKCIQIRSVETWPQL